LLFLVLGLFSASRLQLGEGVVHEASVAALVSIAASSPVAVHQLLLSQVQESATLECPPGFQRAHSGERPAGAAAALVLDGVDNVLVPPVQGGGGVRHAEGGLGHGVGEGVHVLALTQVSRCEGFEGLVGELVHREPEVQPQLAVERVGLCSLLVVVQEGLGLLPLRVELLGFLLHHGVLLPLGSTCCIGVLVHLRDPC